jgi:RNA polymerase sigma-70 factor (ECF subfamily)
MADLSRAFLDALAREQRALDLPALEERLGDLWRRATAAWPELALEQEGFLAHLARHLPERDGDAYLREVHVEDLALAHACSRGDHAALGELEGRQLAPLRPALARAVPAAPADEVVQRLRERVLVGVNGRARIADYAGRGPLGAWLRAVAVRIAVDLLRERDGREEQGGAALEGVAVADADPELALLRSRYAGEFQAALQQALETLTPRDRNLLRFSYLEGLSIDDIGALYQVHRATASRWIAHARRAIMAETRRMVKERLAVTDSELSSLMRALRSQLHISLSAIWR